MNAPTAQGIEAVPMQLANRRAFALRPGDVILDDDVLTMMQVKHVKVMAVGERGRRVLVTFVSELEVEYDHDEVLPIARREQVA